MENLVYIICMKCKTDKLAYLGPDVGDSANWVFTINESIWFKNYTDAENYANKYFKNFKDWFIVGL